MAAETQWELRPVYCPECGLPAWVEWADRLGSTSGPLEMLRIRCFGRHWFYLPADRLEPASSRPC